MTSLVKVPAPAQAQTTPPVNADFADAMSVISARVRDARKQRGWTLREFAERCGVSRAMVSRIERGEANPSVETLWRVLGALGLAFTDLAGDQPSVGPVLRRGDGHFMRTDDGFTSLRLLFSHADLRRIEIYTIEIEPYARSEWQGTTPAPLEYVLVTSGKVRAGVLGNEYLLEGGDALVLRADRPHVYEALDEPVSLVCVNALEGEASQEVAASSL